MAKQRKVYTILNADGDRYYSPSTEAFRPFPPKRADDEHELSEDAWIGYHGETAQELSRARAIDPTARMEKVDVVEE